MTGKPTSWSLCVAHSLHLLYPDGLTVLSLVNGEQKISVLFKENNNNNKNTSCCRRLFSGFQVRQQQIRYLRLSYNVAVI